MDIEHSLEDFLQLHLGGDLEWLIPDYWQKMDFVREFNEKNVIDLIEGRLELDCRDFPHANQSANLGYDFYCRTGEISKHTQRLLESHEQFRRYLAIKELG